MSSASRLPCKTKKQTLLRFCFGEPTNKISRREDVDPPSISTAADQATPVEEAMEEGQVSLRLWKEDTISDFEDFLFKLFDVELIIFSYTRSVDRCLVCHAYT